MKLQICFNFLDTIVMGNILEWNQKLKRAAVNKLFKFSNPGTVLEQIIKDKAYQFKDGFYNLSISGSYRLGMEVKSLGNGSYVVCVYEPRLTHQSGIDYTLKYHFAYIGEKQPFEDLLVNCEKPYTTVFNNFTNRDLFDNGVSLDFLINEGEVTSSVKHYLEELKTKHTVTPETKIQSESEEDIVYYIAPMGGKVLDENSTQVKLAFYNRPNNFDFEQGIHNKYTFTQFELEEVKDLLSDREISEVQYLDPRIVKFLQAAEVTYSDRSLVSSIKMSVVDDICTVSFDLDTDVPEHIRAKFIRHMFNKYLARYSDVVFINPNVEQVYNFKISDGENIRYIVLCLLRLKIWLRYQMGDSPFKYASKPKEVKENKPVSRPKKIVEDQIQPRLSFEESKLKSSIQVKEDSDTSFQDTLAEIHKDLLATAEVTKVSEIIFQIEELISKFQDTFNFLPDTYTLSQLTLKGIDKEHLQIQIFDDMSYDDLYSLASALNLNHKPAREFNEYMNLFLSHVFGNTR